MDTLKIPTMDLPIVGANGKITQYGVSVFRDLNQFSADLKALADATALIAEDNSLSAISMPASIQPSLDAVAVSAPAQPSLDAVTAFAPEQPDLDPVTACGGAIDALEPV